MASILLKQELSDVSAERGLLVDRAAAHDRAVAERQRRQEEHEARLIAAKAQRQNDRARKKIAEEAKMQSARRERQMTARAEELAAQRAAKEEERQRQKDEIDKDLAVGAALLEKQQAEKQAKREREWKERERHEEHIASKGAEMHRSAQHEADLRLDDYRALTVLFRALDLNHNGFIEPEELEWLLSAIRFHCPILPQGHKSVPRDACHRGSVLFKRILREFDATVSGRISISGVRKWWEVYGLHVHGIATKALGVFGVGKTGIGSASAFVNQTLECMRKQSKIESVTMIQSHVRRVFMMKMFREKKAAHTLPGSRRCAACRIQALWRMHTARVRDCVDSLATSVLPPRSTDEFAVCSLHRYHLPASPDTLSDDAPGIIVDCCRDAPAPRGDYLQTSAEEKRVGRL